MTGKLTTHVLDTARGRPAAHVIIELWKVDRPGQPERVAIAHTNADGRTDMPLLEGASFAPGTYELVFQIGPYFADLAAADDPPFLDRVPVRFHIADASRHYHIPLLASPWAYSTYRGS